MAQVVVRWYKGITIDELMKDLEKRYSWDDLYGAWMILDFLLKHQNVVKFLEAEAEGARE